MSGINGITIDIGSGVRTSKYTSAVDQTAPISIASSAFASAILFNTDHAYRSRPDRSFPSTTLSAFVSLAQYSYFLGTPRLQVHSQVQRLVELYRGDDDADDAAVVFSLPTISSRLADRRCCCTHTRHCWLAISRQPR